MSKEHSEHMRHVDGQREDVVNLKPFSSASNIMLIPSLKQTHGPSPSAGAAS